MDIAIARMSTETRWLKVNQARPAETQWKLWRKANLLWSTPKGRMFQPLGRWLRNHDARRIRRPAYVYDHTLALRIHDEYQVYALTANGRQEGVQIGHGMRHSDLHPEAVPAEVYEKPDGMWTVRSVTEVVEPEGVPVYDTFQGYLKTLQPREADILQHVQLFLDPAYICYDLQRYFYAGSDGSVRFGTHGSFGRMLANPEGERVASSMGPARCAKIDSYRAESTGMLPILRFLIRIAMFTNMEDPWRGLIGTDSQNMLDSLYKPGEAHKCKQLAILDVLDAEWDLLVEIQEALRELPGVDLIYVKAHQDDRVAYDCLPLMVQLNVDADRLAGKYNREHGASRPLAFMAQTTGVFLLTEAGTQTSKFDKELATQSVYWTELGRVHPNQEPVGVLHL
jgi:hypothetical protein